MKNNKNTQVTLFGSRSNHCSPALLPINPQGKRPG